MEDSKLVDLFLCKNEAAITQTAEKYGERLRNLANCIVADMGTAQECENDTYLTTWNLIPPHEPRTYLFAFLARITRNIALDRCRERNRIKRNGRLVELTREIEECISGREDVENQVDAEELGRVVSKFLRKKSTVQRNAFIRRYWYMDSISAIAKRFLMSESRIKTMLFRMRKELQEYLEKEGYVL